MTCLLAEPDWQNRKGTEISLLFYSFDINVDCKGFQNFVSCKISWFFVCVCSKCLQEACAISLVAFFTFLHCVFSNVSSNRLPEKMHNYIGCICLTSPQCAFSNVSSNCIPLRMHSHIGCICLAFLHCVFSNVFSNDLPEKRHIRTGCIC